MSLAIDPSTPALSDGTVSSAFSPPADSLIVVLWANQGNNTSTTTVSDSASLTWTQLGAIGGNASAAQVWCAYTTSAQSNMTVSVAYSGTIAAVVFTGADPVQNGAVQTVTSGSSTPSISTPSGGTTAAGSWCLAVFDDYTSTATVTPSSGQTTTINGHAMVDNNSGSNEVGWVQMTNAPNAAAGSAVTLSVTSPANVSWSGVLVEILPAPPNLLISSGFFAAA